ncbi:MAG: penicillin acylase family protein [Candidatus Latescibacteria bacterium]|nr:penicillin acylase family protein [Candidatus Latescibacterota bacterium]
MMMRLVVVVFACLTMNIQAQEDGVVVSGAQDSIDALLTVVPVEVVVAELGDSLFLVPERKARIFRDAYGVPHVYGQTDLDTAFGFGYAQAQDHLLEMVLNFKQAKGELSEIKGKAYVEKDYRALLWRIHSVAGNRYGDLPESTRNYIESFVEGINHYIEVHRRVLPHWVDEVRAVDVVALSRWLMFLFAEQTGMPELEQKGLAPTIPKLPGSNQWVVGPSRSATGKPIFVMDAQMPYHEPFQMYEAHLVSNEGLGVYGTTFYGLPVIFMGHNEQLAWSMTTNDVDVFDVYEERLDPANDRRYFYEDEKQRMTSRQAKIKVRGEAGAGVYEVERELLYTERGPVYKTIDQWAYACRTSMEDLVDLIGQLHAMNKAFDVGEFRQTMARLELPLFNVMIADVLGDVHYVFNGRVPGRSEEFNWRTAVPGWTAETQWQNVLTFSQLPKLENPVAGFMQNCNVAPNLVTVESGLDQNAFPPYLGWGHFNHRGQRVLNYLLTHRGIAVADMQTLVRDNYLIDAEELKALILRAYNRTWNTVFDPNAQVGTAVHLLRSWDNRMDRDSRGALLFWHWKRRYDDLATQLPDSKQRDLLAQEKLAFEALRTAVASMMSTYGRLDVAWEEVHHLHRGETTFPIAGSAPGVTAVQQTWTETNSDGLLNVVGGSAYTMVVSLTEPVQSWSTLAFGNSEDPESPHFADQAKLQSEGRFKGSIVDEPSIESDLTSVLTVPFDEEELERESLRAFWAKKRKMGVLAPLRTNGAVVDSTETSK